VRRDEGREMLAPDLLLPLGQHDDVHWEGAARGEVRLERGDVQPELAFVVDAAARVDVAIADRGLERGRGPELERLRRLHVVMPVDEDRRRARRRLSPLCEHHRMSRGRMRLDREPDARKMSVQPGGGGGDIACALRARAHTRDAQEGEEVVMQALIVGVEPGRESGIEGHGREGQVPVQPVRVQS